MAIWPYATGDMKYLSENLPPWSKGSFVTNIITFMNPETNSYKLGDI